MLHQYVVLAGMHACFRNLGEVAVDAVENVLFDEQLHDGGGLLQGHILAGIVDDQDALFAIGAFKYQL